MITTLGIGNLPQRPVEVRESFTDAVIARMMASASAASEGGGLAALETASRFWGSGLASATVKPDNLALAAVTPSVLDSIGRALCRSGESLHVIAVRNGRVTLTPCGRWSVHGSHDPMTWMYRADQIGPDSTKRGSRSPPRQCFTFDTAPHPSRPWQGRSPVRLAIDTFRG